MDSVQTWGDAVSNSFLGLWMRFANFLPSLVVAVVVFIAGVVIASVLGKAVERVLKAAQIDRAMEKFGAEGKLKMAGVEARLSGILGALVKWFLVLVFLMAATEILKLTQVTGFLNDIIHYVPNVIVAVIVLSVAFILAGFVYEIVRSSTKAAGVVSSVFLAKVAKWVIVIFGISIALGQLDILNLIPDIINVILVGIVAALALAFGLAFGLGGREEAALILRKIREDVEKR